MTALNPPDRSDLHALAARAARAGSGGAPVERWNPPDCGAIDMRIASDGRWFYNGSLIGRDALVRLFASVLKVEEDGETYLVTPVEKLRIAVDDAHFVAVDVARGFEGGQQILTFRTNVHDIVTADEAHPLQLPDRPDADFCPYLTVRGRLRAKMSRPVALELADWLEDDEQGCFLSSCGVRFVGAKGALDDE